MNKRFRLIMACACAFLALLSALAYGNAVKAEAQAEKTEAMARYGGEVTKVVVATATLEPGDSVNASKAEEKEWLAELVPEGAFGSLQELEGKTIGTPVAKGSPLCSVNIRGNDDGMEVPSGKVAIAVPLNERLGITSSVEIGSNLAAYKVSEGRTYLISSNVVVISVPTTTSSTNKGAITIAVPLPEVADIMSAASDSTLRLVRPADDLSSEDTASENSNNAYNVPAVPNSGTTTNQEGVQNTSSPQQGILNTVSPQQGVLNAPSSQQGIPHTLLQQQRPQHTPLSEKRNQTMTLQREEEY